MRVLAAAPALLAALGGVGLYYLGSDVSTGLAGGAVVALFLLGYACLAIGRARLRDHPVGGVRWMTGWVIGLVAVGALVATALVVAGLEITDALKKSPKSEGDAIGGLITGALTAFLAAIFTTDLEEGTGELWPSAKTKRALQDKFKGVFNPDSASGPFEAVFNDRLHEHPDVEGWGLTARLARARIIENAL